MIVEARPTALPGSEHPAGQHRTCQDPAVRRTPPAVAQHVQRQSEPRGSAGSIGLVRQRAGHGIRAAGQPVQSRGGHDLPGEPAVPDHRQPALHRRQAAARSDLVAAVLAVAHPRPGIEMPGQPPGPGQQIDQPVVIVQGLGGLGLIDAELANAREERCPDHEGAALPGPLEQEIRRTHLRLLVEHALAPVRPESLHRAGIALRPGALERLDGRGQLARQPDVVLVGQSDEIEALEIDLPIEAAEIGPRRAAASRPGVKPDPRILSPGGLDQRPRAVLRDIVTDVDAHLHALLRQDRLDLLAQPGLAVVGGEQDQDAGRNTHGCNHGAGHGHRITVPHLRHGAHPASAGEPRRSRRLAIQPNASPACATAYFWIFLLWEKNSRHVGGTAR